MVLIIRKLTAWLAALSLLLSLQLPARAEDRPACSAACAILTAGDGRVLYERSADLPAAMASTTKLMTALVALEQLDLNETVLIPEECCGVEGSSMYLRPGEQCSVRKLLEGLLLVSGNDAALALAACLGGEAAFVAEMNRRAAELGMSNTHFVNPHGLPAEGHFASARDLALLMDACCRREDFLQIAAEPYVTTEQGLLKNHNKLLDLCPGCLAGKTGYTLAAGRCLVSCCERDGIRLICVTLSDPRDWEDHCALYDWGFSRFERRDLSDGLFWQLPLVSGTRERIRVRAEPLIAALLPGELPETRALLPRFVFAPVEKGEEAGSLQILLNGRELGRCRLYFEEEAALGGRTE